MTLRNWSARCRFGDMSEFYLGTVQAETELAALREAEALWRSIIPCVPPSMVMIPGIVAFHGDGE